MKRMIIVVAGFMAVAIYLVFAATALFKYPGAYSPLTNWLSDLGNPLVNQSGAIFYNVGCILTGLVLMAFYISLREWAYNDKRLKTLLSIAQISGLISSIFLIITALFPLGTHTSVHAISGKMHVIFLGFFLTFSATVLLRHRVLKKWPAYFGFMTAVVNFIYGAFLHSVFIAEWLAIGMFILYVLLISYNSRFLNKQHLSQGLEN
jgi:hypothetical membrane protein